MTRVCPQPGCPELTTGGRCATHRRQTERARGTRQQRGYDADHLALRARLAPLVATGTVRCWRCQELVTPTDTWDLGHTDDRTAYAGVEHARCNRSAGGKAAHRA